MRGGWGPHCFTTQKNVKIAKVHPITSLYGHEDLVKTKLHLKIHEKINKASYYNLKLQNISIRRAKAT
jgi:hypothetical protein